jgi:hypothetical protein
MVELPLGCKRMCRGPGVLDVGAASGKDMEVTVSAHTCGALSQPPPKGARCLSRAELGGSFTSVCTFRKGQSRWLSLHPAHIVVPQ